MNAGVRRRIDDAVAALHEAKKINDALQSHTKVGSDEWHQHETIDDKLHEALGALGE